MSEIWAARVPPSAEGESAELRLDARVMARRVDGALWLRGTGLDALLTRRLAALRGSLRGLVDELGHFRPSGSRVPYCTLPEHGWVPLAEILVPGVRSTNLPGLAPEPVDLALERSECEATCEMLALPFAAFLAWGLAAPGLRLAPLAFAVADDGRTLVRGKPLPPLPGTLFTIEDEVAVPAGHRIATRIPRGTFATSAGALVVLGTDGSLQRIPREAFARATHSALRSTAGRLNGVRSSR